MPPDLVRELISIGGHRGLAPPDLVRELITFGGHRGLAPPDLVRELITIGGHRGLAPPDLVRELLLGFWGGQGACVPRSRQGINQVRVRTDHMTPLVAMGMGLVTNTEMFFLL